MSPVCENFLRAAYSKNWPVAYANLNGLNMYEMLRGLAALDPEDLKDLFDHSVSIGQASLDRIDYARSVVENRTIPTTAPGDLETTGQVHDANMFVLKATPLTFEHDLTGRCPATGGAGALTATDYQRAATDLGVEIAAIKAVATVESGGRSGFGAGNRPVLRYELHVFHSRTGGKYHKTHPHLSQPSLKAGNPFHTGGQDNEYSLLYGAMLLKNRYLTAWESASWGMFQVMGFNHNGSADVAGFVSAMYESESRQLDSFLDFCKKGGLVKHLKSHDWASFASGYNGADYAVNNYDGKLSTAYDKYAKAI